MDMDFSLFQQIVNRSDENKNVVARFYDKAVKTDMLNDKGFPIFKNITYIEIRLKDNSSEVFNQPATAEKIKRFPNEYALYKQTKEQAQKGTPLEQFAFLNAAEIATCKNRGVFTVEHLAELDFEKVNSLGLQNEHILAQMFMDNSAQNGKIYSFTQKERKYKEKIEKLKDEVEQLKQQLDKISKSKTQRGVSE